MEVSCADDRELAENNNYLVQTITVLDSFFMAFPLAETLP